jgi:hypothetical protein
VFSASLRLGGENQKVRTRLPINSTEHPASSSPSAASAQPDTAGIGGNVVATAVDELLAEFGSAVVAETVAVFEIELPEFTVSTSVTVADALELIVPKEQLTVVVPLQLPCDGVADTNDVFTGIASVTVAPAAALGPALATVIV